MTVRTILPPGMATSPEPDALNPRKEPWTQTEIRIRKVALAAARRERQKARREQVAKAKPGVVDVRELRAKLKRMRRAIRTSERGGSLSVAKPPTSAAERWLRDPTEYGDPL